MRRQGQCFLWSNETRHARLDHMTSDFIPAATLVRLKARYAERHRHYHTWGHIETLLGWLEKIRSALHDPYAVELAVLYHDAIYDPRSKESEAKSADLMMAELEGVTPPETLATARTLILATAGHLLPPTGTDDLLSDCAFFLDMDLSILGADTATFDAYDRAIRAEYSHVPEADYVSGRSAILRGFLGRERLFFCDHFHKYLDAQARQNLKRTLGSLASQAL